MRSMFWKLLGAFWLTSIVILAVAIFMSFYLAGSNDDSLAALEVSLQDILDTSGRAGLKRYLLNPANFPQGRTVYVVDREGRDLARRDLPRPLERRVRRTWAVFDGGMRDRPRRLRLPVLEAADGQNFLALPGPAQPPLFGVLSFAHVQWVVLIVAAIVSLLVFWWLSRSLARPVTRISAAARRLSTGDMSARVGLSGNDEIGQLAVQFDKMASELESQSQNRRELFRNIAHELRAPLTRMQIATDLLERKPESAAEQAERVRYEITRLENLTRQVLALARAEQTSAKGEGCELGEVLTRVVGDANYEGEARNVAVSLAAPEGALPVKGDAGAIASAIENVIRNAVQMGPSGSTVSVAVTADDPRVITIADEGPGVDESELGRIFEPFYRVDTNRPGAGIGLAIAQRVLRQVGGSIVAANRPQGGLEVRMTFPEK